MRPWQILITSTIAATIADIMLFWVSGSQSGVILFATEQWRAIAAIWLFSYSIAALVLTTITTLAAVRNEPRRVQLRRHIEWLALTQYFTAIILLLGLWAVDAGAATSLGPAHPAIFGHTVSLAGGGALAAAGLISWGVVVLGTAMHRRVTAEQTTEKPEILQLRLLRQSIEQLRTQMPSPAISPTDYTQFMGLIEKEHQALLDLTTQVNKLSRNTRRDFAEIKKTLADRMSIEFDGLSATVISDLAAALRDSVAALDAAIARFEEMCSFWAAETPRADGRLPISGATRSRASAELSTLLQELTTPTASEGDRQD
jgi:hypothetical protein